MSNLRPIDIAVSRRRAVLTVTWSDNTKQVISFATLRAACPCEDCGIERAKRTENPLQIVTGKPPSTELASLQTVGAYGIQPTWADGHNAGIFSYEVLRGLPSVETTGSEQ